MCCSVDRISGMLFTFREFLGFCSLFSPLFSSEVCCSGFLALLSRSEYLSVSDTDSVI